MGKSRIKNVLMSTGAGLIVRAASIILNFVLKTVFIKNLGIQYTGVSTLFTDILTVLSFAELGIGGAITYALYKPVAENDSIQIAKLMNFYKSAYRFVALVVMTVGLALVPFLDKLVTNVPDIKENITVIYILYLANTTCSYLLVYKSAILTAKQEKYEISKIEGFIVVIRTLVECVILIVFRQFLVYLVTDILITITQNILISRRASKEYEVVPGSKDLKLDKKEKKTIFHDVAALAMYQISAIVLSSTDSTIISATLGTAVVGVLSSYRMITGEISGVIQQFLAATTASVGNLAVEKNSDDQYRLFKGLNFMIFWISAFCSVSLFILLNPFVEIWLGKEYLLSKSVVFALVADFFAATMIRVVGMFRNSNGLFIQGKYRPVIMAALNIGLSIALVKPLGVFGVLIATVISRLLTQAWYDPWLVHKRVFQKNVKRYYLQYILYVAVIAASITAIEIIINLVQIKNIFLSFLFDAVLCLIIPNLLILVFWHKTEDFKESMSRIRQIVQMGKKRG